MATETHFDTQVTVLDRIGAAAASIAAGANHFFDTVGNAQRISTEFERLNGLSDDQLSARGMTRSEIGQKILHRYGLL